MNKVARSDWDRSVSAAMDVFYGEKHDSISDEMRLELVSADYDRQELVYRFFPTERCVNTWGVMHGGLVAMLFDTAMGLSGRAVSGRYTVPTVMLQVQYLIPHIIGKTMTIKVKVNSCGKTLTSMQAECTQEGDERIHSTATGTYILKERPLWDQE